MKLTVEQSALEKAISTVSKAVPSRPGHPVLANILMIADSGKLTLAGFDLSLGIQVSIDADVEDEGVFTLPAKLFGDIVSRLPDGNIEMDLGSGEVNISSLPGSYKIRGLSAREYPELPTIKDGECITIAPEILSTGLSATLFATSDDETKQVLTGAHITIQKDCVEFASTDGHRLSVLTSIQDGLTAPKVDQVTIPSKALQEVLKAVKDEPVTIQFDSGWALFEMGSMRLTTRLLEGEYPNYRRLIPKEFMREMTCDRRQLLSSLERIAVLADQKNNPVKLTITNGELAVSAEASEVGSGKETIPVLYTGDDLTIAFNVKYLMEGLKAMSSSEVQISMNTATSPAIVCPLGGAKMTYLVMPVQVRD